MTTSRPEADHQLDLTREALRHTAGAWGHGMTAAIGHDVHEARRVMRGAQARRSTLRTAHQHLQWIDAPRGLMASRRSSTVNVVADLMRINRLLGQLAQTIIATPEISIVDDRQRADLEVARRIGVQRLDYFANTLPSPELHHDYVTAGHALLDALADLADSRPRRGTTPDICLSLMIVLVETSRHATRVA